MSTKIARRKKRLAKRITPLEASDRQFFAAQRKIRRARIDEWQQKNKPQRFIRRVTQFSLQASVRQAKQHLRDELKSNAQS